MADSLRSKYGIDVGQKAALLRLQSNECPVCCTPLAAENGVIDHDHEHEAQTGVIKIRGMLCGSCNTLLDFAHDDPTRLQNAIKYLAVAANRGADWVHRATNL